ncbi:MAG: hypothetical protein WA949_15305 [Phormidesmis sp.]
MKKAVLLAAILFLGTGVAVIGQRSSADRSFASAPLTSQEAPVIPIEIEGPLADRDSEVSGLDWYGDYLILLPQYPDRLGGNLFAIAKSDILSTLNSESSGPLSPVPITLLAGDLAEQIEGFEGFEAIAFKGDQVFLTVEASASGGMKGYVVSGTIENDLSQIVIDPDKIAESPVQSNSPNKADEALLVTEEALVSIYEVNGVQLNLDPQAHTFDFDLRSQPSVSFPNVEYRITDVTGLDERDRFWAINYFYPGDVDLIPTADPLAVRHGKGLTHRQQKHVERLIEFDYVSGKISLTNTAPIQLELAAEARNWEGIVCLDDKGFLIVTDKFPSTILGYVPLDSAP